MALGFFLIPSIKSKRMSASNSGKYQNFREKFTFRNQGALTIPKSGDGITLARETCYKLTVDVVIESVTQQQYRNFRSLPYTGFYGYASLVKRDCIDPRIELNYGRNRIFEQRIDEAFVFWNALSQWHLEEKRFHINLKNGGKPEDDPEYIFVMCSEKDSNFSFSETDLREVYVKCVPDTQFYIELAWVSPIPFTDDCGKDHFGKSNEPDDPDKDDGLPPEGSQPKQNDPSSPWSGNRPFSPPPSGSPYENNKAGTDANGNPLNPNSNNSGINGEDPSFTRPPDPEGTIYWIKVVAKVKSGNTAQFPCVKTRVNTYYYQLLDDTITWSVSPYGSPSPSGCGDGKNVQAWGITLSGGDGTPISAPNSTEGVPQITKESGLVLPSNTEVYE